GLIIHDPNGIEKTCECPNDMDHMSRALWNTRPIEDALRSENERLRAKIDREVTQFNDGYETAKAGKPESDRIYFDYEVDEDQWLIGYAWQRFDSMKLEISTIRSLLKEAKEDGERLFKATRPIYSKGGTPGFNGRRPHFCDFCGRSPAYEHKTDCPIAMHRALMEKLKQENL
ncbi:MAG: hypothetical protein WC433_05140, partial [Candidatus Omnitrophota bacterium]